MDDEYDEAVEYLHNCEYPDNSPQDLDDVEAERRMRYLWIVFNRDHPSEK